MTETITVAGAKGGVGKTTISINLGTVSALSGTDTLLLEADLAMANVVDFLDLPFDPETDPSLHDVLTGDAAVDDAIVRAESGLAVLPSGGVVGRYADLDMATLGPAIRDASDDYELTVVDTAAGVSQKTLVPMGLADRVVLVTTPRVSAMRDTTKTVELVDRVDGTAAGVVVNEVGSGNAPPPERLAAFLDVPLLGGIPLDDAVAHAQDRGKPVVADDPSAPAAGAFADVAEELGLAADRRVNAD